MNTFITGANKGIGLELTKTLAINKRHNVFVGVRNSSTNLEEIPNVKIHTGLDQENYESIENFFQNIELPQLDLIILNAGVLLETPLKDLYIEDVEKQIKVNALSPLLITKKLMPYMREGTKLAFTSSLMGSIQDNNSGGYYGYRMSKVALNMAVKSLSVDLKNLGVSVISMHPGYVKTEMTDFMGNIPPESSALGLLRIIETLSISNSGNFYNYKGDKLPW